MEKRMIIITVLITALLIPSLLPAVETAPRISDREIIERLTKLEEGQKHLEKRIDVLRSEMNSRFDDLRSEMNGGFNILQWMLGLFITIALVILGFVLRMQWQMQRRQTSMETSLETYKDELAFIKGLVEKLLPPRGAL
jgi:predicted PurR-regulated permease PerM